jgi:hypothetical protein
MSVFGESISGSSPIKAPNPTANKKCGHVSTVVGECPVATNTVAVLTAPKTA